MSGYEGSGVLRWLAGVLESRQKEQERLVVRLAFAGGKHLRRELLEVLTDGVVLAGPVAVPSGAILAIEIVQEEEGGQ